MKTGISPSREVANKSHKWETKRLHKSDKSDSDKELYHHKNFGNQNSDLHLDPYITFLRKMD